MGDEREGKGQKQHSLLSILQKYIDTQWMDKNMMIILCGSTLSFMEKKVLSEKSPIFGRRDSQIKLEAFNYLDSALFVPKYTAEEKAQIDLIIKRADKVINVCEMKFYDGDYVMKKKDYDDIERRVRVFRSTNGIRQAIHPVLVTTYGLANNQYSSAFQNVVTLKDLFK